MNTLIRNISIGLLVASTTFTQAQQLDLSLQDALKLMREKNKSLQYQNAEKEVARALMKEAKGNFLPTINLNGSYQYYFDRQVIFMPGSFVGNELQPVVDVAVGGKNAFQTNIYLQQVLLNEAARKQLKSSKLEFALQNHKSLEAETEMTVQISESYYTIQLLQTSIQLHEQSLARNQKALNDARSLYQQGKALKVDTLRNYIAVENLNATISYLINQRKIQLLNLKNNLGIAPDMEINLTDSLILDTPVMPEFITDEEALAKRHDIHISRLQASLSKSHLEQSRAMRLPTLTVVGSYQLQAQADNRKFNDYTWPRTSYVGLQATMPIFTGNRLNAKINQSSWRLTQSQIALQQLQENALTEKASLENELREAIKQVNIQNKTVEAATLSYQVINERYQQGLSSRLELSDAELALTTSKMNQLNAYYRVKITQLKLAEATGQLKS